jgi:class 3 adenylate cyclase/tetratricopeptide (TPR) repeat protein
VNCHHCQEENRADARFCRECGTPFRTVCASCGAKLDLSNKFCDNCGSSVAAISASTLTASRFASPDAYTPKHLGERILTSRSALEGERKQVTVLFADIKSSMELLADRDPEEARRILDPVLEHMIEAVHRYEGTVNQVMGDGIMALFGAPLAHEDHAIRAGFAALRMQNALKLYAEDVRRTSGIPIQVRVGLNSGEVVVRSIGSDLRMDYTAVGQTTHLAARMEQIAEAGSILAAPTTVRLTEGFIATRSLGPQRIKGLPTPVEVSEVIGVGSMRSRLHVAVHRGLTEFVGRTVEMAQLREAFELTAKRRGQIVAVVAEPGVGKSRLFWEFKQGVRTECLIIETGGISYGRATAYLAMTDLLKAYFSIDPSDDVGTIHRKVENRLVSLDPLLKPLLPALLWLLDIPMGDDASQHPDPRRRRQTALDAVKKLLIRQSEDQPLVVIVEDLHWIDAETQAILDGIVDGLATARVLLLVNYRPEYHHDWSGKTYYRQLYLDPLPPEDAGKLLDVLLGEDGGLASLKRFLIERTDGTPFFLEECVRSLEETGVLHGRRGAYRRVNKEPNTLIPPTVEAVLAGRIDRLSPEAKRILQVASVLGTDVRLDLLRAIGDDDGESLDQWLRELQGREFLYEVVGAADMTYVFRHALVRDVAYESMLADSRRALHQHIATVVERLYPYALDEHVDELAHHTFQGELWGKAALYLRRAGLKAAERTAYRTAVDWFEKGLVSLSRDPGADRTTAAIDIRFDLRHAYLSLGKMDRALALVDEAQRLAEAIQDPRRLATALALRAAHLAFNAIGDARALENAKLALSISETLDDDHLRAVATFFIGRIHYIRGDYTLAAEHFGRSIATLWPETTRQVTGFTYLPAVNFRTWQAWALAELGSFSAAFDAATSALRLAQDARSSYDEILALCAVGGTQLRRGDAESAVEPLRRALMLCRTYGVDLLYMPAASRLGYAYALAGQHAEARDLLDETVKRPEIAPSVTNVEGATVTSLSTLWLVWLGQALLLVGDLRMAEQLIRSVMAASAANQHGTEAWAHHTMTEIAFASGPGDVMLARDSLARAQELAEQLKMRPLLAHCHLSAGRFARVMGDREEARRALSICLDEYTSLTMTTWAERAKAELIEVH